MSKPSAIDRPIEIEADNSLLDNPDQFYSVLKTLTKWRGNGWRGDVQTALLSEHCKIIGTKLSGESLILLGQECVRHEFD